MGHWADGLIQGQKPRDNGCICASALIPLTLGAWVAVQGAAFGIFKAAEAVT